MEADCARALAERTDIDVVILAGDSTADDVVGDTDKGFYAKSLGGGQVNPATGEPGGCALAQQHLPCDPMSNDPLHAMGLN